MNDPRAPQSPEQARQTLQRKVMAWALAIAPIVIMVLGLLLMIRMRAHAQSAPPRSVEQTRVGTAAAPRLVAQFDGLGVGFTGPQGTATLRNPSDNSLAVGPDQIVQIVNTRMAIYTKRGATYDTTGKVLYGPVPTNNVFRGFGGACEARNSGDAVVRYDQLARRWLIVMPVFQRSPRKAVEPREPKDGEPAALSMIGHEGQPGPAVRLYEPPPPPPPPPTAPSGAAPAATSNTPRPPADSGSYAMCYAISTGTDAFGPYYRYEFTRPLFPDYPRPAVWPDGYYLPTSTSDDLIQKHACVVDRARMLKGEPATEQCLIVDGVNFLNNVDLDGTQLPPPGAPNIVLAAGGTQLKKVLEDSAIYAWQFHVDWKNPANTKLSGPTRLAVAPYQYLCGGQLTNCVPQPGTDRKLDAQGDKLMARVTYRRIGARESIVALHSINAANGAGGVRWYEFTVQRRSLRNAQRAVQHDSLVLRQQGTLAFDSSYRWMPSAAMDKFGNIGIGYSFGGTPFYPGQRFVGRRANDPLGIMSTQEAVLVNGESSQTNTLRWEDYTQTAVDPSDDCTIWYVGDYLRAGASAYSSRIGAFRLPGCK